MVNDISRPKPCTHTNPMGPFCDHCIPYWYPFEPGSDNQKIQDQKMVDFFKDPANKKLLQAAACGSAEINSMNLLNKINNKQKHRVHNANLHRFIPYSELVQEQHYPTPSPEQEQHYPTPSARSSSSPTPSPRQAQYSQPPARHNSFLIPNPEQEQPSYPTPSARYSSSSTPSPRQEQYSQPPARPNSFLTPNPRQEQYYRPPSARHDSFYAPSPKQEQHYSTPSARSSSYPIPSPRQDHYSQPFFTIPSNSTPTPSSKQASYPPLPFAITSTFSMPVTTQEQYSQPPAARPDSFPTSSLSQLPTILPYSIDSTHSTTPTFIDLTQKNKRRRPAQSKDRVDLTVPLPPAKKSKGSRDTNEKANKPDQAEIEKTGEVTNHSLVFDQI